MSDRKHKNKPTDQPRPKRPEGKGPAAKRVLLVEDSPTQAQALGAALEAVGYEAVIATSGDDALHRLEPDGFDIVVSDIVMPGEVDGYELCRRIKQGPLKDVPVVLFTSLADPLDIIHGLECGADNFFTKSHGTEHLLQRIKVLLETKEARAQGRVRLGVKIFFLGREFTITSDREQIIDLLMSTFEDAVFQNRELLRRETELARSHQALRGLYQLAVGLNQVTSEAEVLETALDRALDLPGVQAGWISLRDGDSGFRLAAARNLPPALQGRGAMEGDCLCRRRLLSGELDSVTNILECERLQRARGDTGGLRYHATIPLWLGNRTVGVMNLVGADQGLFSDDDLKILYGVGNEIAVALERAQLQEGLEKLVEARTAALAAEISERKRTDAALRESEARVRRVIDSSLLGMLFWDLDGRVLDANDQFLQTVGYSREDLLGGGLDWKALTPPEWEPADRKALEEIVRLGRCTPFEKEYFRKDGTRVPILLGGVLLAGESREGVSFVLDITDRRQLEQQLRQAQKMEAVGRLAGGVAHDFNNLLTVILGECDMLLEEVSAEHPTHQPLAEIRKAAERAAGLTRQLLSFSRRQLVEPTVFNPNTLVTDTEKMLRRLIGEDIDLETRTAPRLGNVRADRGQIEQILVNLVVNSRDAMPQGGKLLIETSNVRLDEDYTRGHADVTPGEFVVLSVSDTGSGMTEEVKQHLFEPFFTTKEHGKGTGLGLATSYGIVKQFGGHIGAYSEVGVGSTMKVYLPRVQEDPTSADVSTQALRGGKETILVVEDEEAVRRMAARVLTSKGYSVIQAGDGEEALRVLASHSGPVHLVLTDVVLPKMGGRVLAEQVRALYPNTRVLFASGYTDDMILQHQLLQRDVQLIQKPFTAESLARKVREVLDEPREPV